MGVLKRIRGPGFRRDDNLLWVNILDGKEISKSALEQIKVSNIGSINILKGNSAVKQYGDKGESGVIVITTKSN